MGDKTKSFVLNVVDTLIEQIKVNAAPWQRPWFPGESESRVPINPINNKRYKGINAIHLMGQNRSDPRWMTYKQASRIGGQVRMGEKGTPVQYWKFSEESTPVDSKGEPVLDANGRPSKKRVPLDQPKLAFAVVFNAEQIDGLPAFRKEMERIDVTRVEHLFEACGAKIQTDENAFYRFETDRIHLPDKSRFASAAGFYTSALHELCHWTGHASRLDRDLAHPFGSQGCAKEELRAEISSMLLGHELGLGYAPRHPASYSADWVKILQDDPLEIFRAAADAEKICEHVVSLSQTQHLQIQDGAPEGEEVNMHRSDAGEAQSLTNKESQLNALGELGRLKTLSVLTARRFEPSKNDRMATYMAVLRDSKPILLCGPDEDHNAYVLARELAGSAHLGNYLGADHFSLAIGSVLGSDVAWGPSDMAILAKPSVVSDPAREGSPIAIVLSNPALAESLCVTAETARTIDPRASVHLDDGHTLLALTRGDNLPDGMVVACRRVSAEVRLAARWMHEVWGKGSAKTIGIDLDDTLKALDRNDLQGMETAAGILSDIVDIEKDILSDAITLGVMEDLGVDALTLPTFEGASNLLREKLVELALVSSAAPRNEQSEPVASAVSAGADRQYLAVPYAERTAAKSAGALWDKQARSWYAGPKADMSGLRSWLPENTRRSVAMDPRQEFAGVLRSLGFILPDSHPIMDGKSRRVAVEGDKRGEKAGFYVGHLDGRPAGYAKNNRSGVHTKWKAKGYTLTSEEKARLQAEAAAKLAERALELSRNQERVAERVSAQLKHLVPISGSTPYLASKGVAPSVGVYTDKEGTKTYIPAYDINGKHWTTQYIRVGAEGEGAFVKRLAKDSKKEGCFHAVGGMKALAAAPAIVVAEGYATAATLSEALGHATVAAFDAGNLLPVVKALHDRWPEKPVVVAGEDDLDVQRRHGTNPGRTRAQEAAKAVGGRAVFPIFAPGEQAAHPKQFTDFNDLATRSVLGKEAVKRQLRPEIAKLLQIGARSRERVRSHPIGDETRTVRRSVG